MTVFARVAGIFDEVVLDNDDEIIKLSREEFTKEAILFFNLSDEAFEEFFEFLKDRRSRA